MENAVMSMNKILVPNPDERQQGDMEHQMTESVTRDVPCDTYSIDQVEFERLPDKQTKALVNNEILKDVLQNLETYLQLELSREHRTNPEKLTFLAAHFKYDQMKTSPLSPAIIEAALTIIIDRMNNENTANDEQYARLKQLSLSISYTDESEFYKKGVREFQMHRRENAQSKDQ